MFDGVLWGSLVAFGIWALSVFCLSLRQVPTYYFAAILGGCCTLRIGVHSIAKRLVTSGDSRRNDLAYWLGAVGSSLLAPLLLIVSCIKVF